MNTSSKSGKLWVVATPLGNYGDLSPRAREVLQKVDYILAEDTRKTGRLLADCNIDAPPMTSFHDFNESSKLQAVLEQMHEGKDMALVSDAGTPLLSDPGYLLVRQCHAQGITVCPVPGPSAVTTALSASGIAPLPFAFLGFPPRKENDIARFFSPYSRLAMTLVFFERKDRLGATLAIAFEQLGNRQACIARELTKTYEEFIPFQLAEYANISEGLLGEITVVIGPPDKLEKTPEEQVKLLLVQEQTKGGKPKEIAKRVTDITTGWSTKEIYALLK